MDHPLFTKDRILYSEPGQPSPAKTFFSSLCARIRRQVAETEMNFSEVIFLRKARRLRRMVEHVLGMPPDSLTGASLLPQGKMELLAKRLEAQCSLEEYKKLYGELPRKEPETPVVNTFPEMARWCRDFLAGKLVEEFFEACAKQKAWEVPSSPLAKAVNYALNQQEALEKFLTDPRLNIDNNPAENVIRPLAIGRKNWLFAGNEAGGKHLAVLASFAATCKKNNVHFRAWLEDILLKLGSTPSTQIDSLLPHLWNGAD